LAKNLEKMHFHGKISSEHLEFASAKSETCLDWPPDVAVREAAATGTVTLR
jgi:hypothetical protein